LAITPPPTPNAAGVTVPSHQVSTLRPLNVCSLRLAATSGGASCRNQTRLPAPSTIIGPPGPTGLIVTVLLLSGWTTGEGNGVSRTSPLPRAPFELWLTVTLGGIRPGSVAK
jgi:hypothetical protein